VKIIGRLPETRRLDQTRRYTLPTAAGRRRALDLLAAVRRTSKIIHIRSW
jgi:hypothetical protein